MRTSPRAAWVCKITVSISALYGWAFTPVFRLNTGVATRQQIFADLAPDTSVPALSVDLGSRPESNIVGNDACLNNRTVELYNNLTNQITEQYAVDLLYWRTGHDKLKDHPIFGEHTTAEFDGPYAIRGMVTINASTTLLESFGLTTDDDLDLYIAFDEWEGIFTNEFSPIADDRFEIRHLYCPSQAPSGHTNLKFEVTSQGDGELNKVFLLQKYYWVIKAKRADFSWMPNEPRETNDNDVFDGTHIGPVEGTGDPPTTEVGEETTDNNDLDALADENFDVGDKGDVFGGYR